METFLVFVFELTNGMEECRQTAAMRLGVESGKTFSRVTVVWLEAECLEEPDTGREGTQTNAWSQLDATKATAWLKGIKAVWTASQQQVQMCSDGWDTQGWRSR